MALYQLGITYRTADQDARAAFAQDEEVLRRLTERLLAVAAEAMPLATCGRFEVYVAAPAVVPAAVDEVVEEVTGIAPSLLADGRCERRRGTEVVRHLLRVATGLDSEIVGEGEVLRQVREAAEAARRAGALAGELGVVVRQAVAAAKRIRSVTGLGAGAHSIGSLAARAALEQLGDLGRATAVVVGSGQVADLALTHLTALGLKRVAVAGRDPEHTRNLAARYGGSAHRWEEVEGLLETADLVVSATSAPHLIFDRRLLERVQERRRGRLLVVLDLAQPRDVDAAAARLRGVRLFDLAHFGRLAEESRRALEEEVRRAERLVDEALLAVQAELSAREAAPLIRALTERADRYLEEETARLMRRGDFTPEQQEAIRRFGHRLTMKLLNDPLLGLREEAARGGDPVLEVARRLLRLPKPETPAGWEGGEA